MPEFIISIHLCKIQSWCVAEVSTFFHNLTTNIKLINLKSLIDIAHYGNDDLSFFHCVSCQKRMFFQFAFQIQNWSSSPIAPFLPQSNKTLQYFQLLDSLTNRTLSPWSLWKLSSRVDLTDSNKQPRTGPRGNVYAVGMKRGKRHVQTDGSTKYKRLHYYLGNFHLRGDLQTKTKRTTSMYTFPPSILSPT